MFLHSGIYMKSSLVICRDGGEVKKFRVAEALSYDELIQAVREEFPKAKPILICIENSIAKQNNIKAAS